MKALTAAAAMAALIVESEKRPSMMVSFPGADAHWRLSQK
jgi:hypothetical protein